MIAITEATRTVGLSRGSVMCRNWLHPLAPSMDDAS